MTRAKEGRMHTTTTRVTNSSSNLLLPWLRSSTPLRPPSFSHHHSEVGASAPHNTETNNTISK